MASFLRPPGRFNVKKIAIIGAGPAGLSAAKYLIAERYFDKIDIYEQQAEVGGVWNYTPLHDEEVSLPSITPHVPLDKPIWPEGTNLKAPLFSSPMYEKLNANIPKDLMAFSEQPFPSTSLLFPTRQDVQEYVVKYSQDVRHLINFSTQVADVVSKQSDGDERWELTSQSTITKKSKTITYDAIIVASGHYNVPFIPSVPGMIEFSSKFPGSITHSKIYRSPKGFTGKKVVVVGNGPSGVDIGSQISNVSQKPLLNSVTTPTPGTSPSKKEEVPRIVEYLPEQRGVRFEDGRVEGDVDCIVYCTGYLYSYPFLENIEPAIVTTGRRGLGLYKHAIDTAHPTLAFPAMMQKVIPFPISAVQAAVIAKIWSNRLELPSNEKMGAWERDRAEEFGQGTSFHVLAYPQDANYINELHDWAKSGTSDTGKEPPYWDGKAFWTRKVFAEIRKKFIETGGCAKTMEELGFNYEETSNKACN